VPGLPLRILQRFEPEHDWVLEPGDLLYLPPMWGHDGTAVGECMTCSVGFRSPRREGLADDLLQRLADSDGEGPLYRDPRQSATLTPGRIPPPLQDFALQALQHRLRQPQGVQRVLGEVLSEPKPHVWFQAAAHADPSAGVRLDRRSRMLYDEGHVYLNGESFRVGGRDARLMRQLADRRRLSARECAALGAQARDVVQGWLDDGWLQMEDAT